MQESRTTVAGQTRALELALDRAPIGDVLDVLIATVEAESKGLAAIQLLEDGRRLRCAASPSLPDAYTAALDGIEIGPTAGSCGAAAFTRQAVDAGDIEHDPRWANYRDTALAHGLRACWSIPLVGKSGDLLGTFALYHKEVGVPSASEKELVELISRTAALVIERDREARVRQAAEQELAYQVSALQRLHVLATRLAQIDVLGAQLHEILGAAAELHGTTCGMLSVYDPATGALEPAATLAFPARAIAAIRDITGGPTRMPHGSAFASSTRTIVEDTEIDPRFVGYRRIARDVGFRAVHSTPILTRGGELLGVLSLHATRPGRPSELQLRLMDMCALHAADAIEAGRDRERLALLADNMSQLAWISDERGSAIWFNRRWLDYTGCKMSEVTGWGWAQVHHPDHVNRVTATLNQALIAGVAWEDTFPLRGSDGTWRWFLSRAQPIRDAQNKVARWFGTSTDITEQRETAIALALAKEEAEAASKAKDHFLAALSHELRTPLSPILMAASALEVSPELPPQLRSRVTMIRRNVELETKMIDDLLDVSRITSGKLVLDLQPVAIAETIDDVLEICRTQIEQKQLVIRFSHDGDGVVSADPGRLRQILWNLVKNAAKFTPAGGTITIRADATKELATVSVRDTGIGIEAEALGRVFDAFEQADAAITRQFGGLGLGLAISRTLVALHGGALAVASEGRDRGATFTLTLPRIDEPVRRSNRVAVVRATTSVRRLLVVDDHADTAEILSTILTSHGYEVSVAATATAAFTLATSGAYDLMISDVGLSDGTGYELLERIREIQPQLAIAMSGYGHDADIRRGREAGFVGHLVKPIGFDQLLDTIESLIG